MSKRRMKLITDGKCFIGRFLAASLIWGSLGTMVYAESVPSIVPTNSNGKSVLFDNAHAQTAGAADWVIDGGFSDFANGLAEEGYYIKELRKNSEITYSDLIGYDVFVIPEANVPFKVTEQEALEAYVENGGSILFIADHYNADRNKNRWDSSEVFNGYRRGAYSNPAKGMSSGEANSLAMQGVESSDWLAENFGVRFRYNALGDLSANVVVSTAESFNITKNINSVAMHAGSTIAITNPQIAKGIIYVPSGLTTSSKWSSAVDNGVYNGGGIAEGAYVAISKKGKGKAAFIGDSSLVEDSTPKYKREENGKTKTTYDGYLEEDDALLLKQLTNWLAEQEDYNTFAEAGIKLDEATVLYDYETPSLSTEPKSEPWATPASGYKWYDSSTFKNGAYIYTDSTNTVVPTVTPTATVTPTPSVTPETDDTDNNNVVGDETYQFCFPTQVLSNVELPLAIEFKGLKANTTISGLKIGAYTGSGTQVGMFKEIDGTWPTTYAYSDAFSVTTDENGNATKVLLFKIKPNTKGSVNVRMKKGTSKLVTASITVE